MQYELIDDLVFTVYILEWMNNIKRKGLYGMKGG